MATSISIVGWHIHPEAAVCEHCDDSASYVAEFYVDEGFPCVINLCLACANSERYEISQDKVAQVFEDLGF